MSIQAKEEPNRSQVIRGILLTSLCCVLPALSTGFDWLRTFIPLAPFCFCVLFGQEIGRRITLFGFLVAVAFSIVIGNSGNIIFPLALLPVGIGLALTAEWEYSPAKAGLITTALILAGWIISGLFYYTTTGQNPYNEGLQAMDKAFADLAEMYKTSSDIPEDVLRDVIQGIETMRQATQAIFPSLLIATAIFTSWVNMVLGNRIIRNSDSGITVWPVFKYWRISDNLIWILIIAGMSSLIPLASIKGLGLNLLLIMGTIYFFQGVAVLLAVLDRFKTPTPVRFLIYVLLVVQTYSVFIIAIIGIIDVWKDLGKIYSQPKEN
ncbi:MAG: DUF2232 domain-containing protein [Desulfobulbaceae bacterium]|nr:DUF2232 domain-containing protein [Desulfobulbaceae bacterium]